MSLQIFSLSKKQLRKFRNLSRIVKDLQVSLTSKGLYTSSKTFQNLLKLSAWEVPIRRSEKMFGVLLQ